MMDTYYIASLKLSGWMSKTGQYTTDLKDAREFDRMEALIMVKKQRNGGNVVVPVRKEDMEWAG
jgi:hypothetical protein